MIVLVLACSNDVENPEINQPPDPEGIKEGEGGEEDGIPFSISVLLKKYAGINNEGDYFLVDFTKGRHEGSDPLNITQSIGLSAEAGFLQNGKETILVFAKLPEKYYVTYDVLSGETRAATYAELFPEGNACFLAANQTAWNATKVFSFENDGCSGPGSIRVLVSDLESGEVTELSMLENAYTGDTSHGVWLTDDYFLVHYDDRSPDAQMLTREGLVVYDAKTLEQVYATNSPSIKSIYIDGDQLLIASRLDSVELIDLSTPELGLSKMPNPSFPENTRIGNISVYNGKIGTLLPEGNFVIPAYYDIVKNEYSAVNREPYLAFFNRDTIDFTAEVLRPEEFKFDMETGTFAITYLIFDPQEGIPKSSAIVFMDFEGNVLFQQNFPPTPFLPVKIAGH